MSMSMKAMTEPTVPSESPSRPSENGREDTNDNCKHADDDVYFVVC